MCELCLWILWGLLLLAAGFQARLLITKDLEVPGFVLRLIEARARGAGLVLDFGSAGFDLDGRVFLQNVRVSASGVDDTLFACRAMVIDLNLLDLAARNIDPSSVEIIDGRISCPAVVSPTGVQMPLATSLDALFEKGASGWNLARFSSRLGSWFVHARGPLRMPPRPPAPPAEAAAREPPVRRIAGWLRRAALFLAEAERAPLASADILLHTWGHGRDLERVDIRLLCPSLSLPGDARCEGIEAMLTLRPSTDGVPAGRLRLSLQSTCVPALDVTAPGMHASASWPAQEFSTMPAGRLDLSLATVARPGFSTAGLVASVDAPAAGCAAVGARLGGGDCVLDATTLVKGRAWPEWLTLRGSVGPRTLEQVEVFLPEKWRGLLRAGEPIRVCGTASLSPDGRPLAADARVDAIGPTAGGVFLEEAAGHVRWNAGEMFIDDIWLRSGPSRVSGSYRVANASRDYRFLLHGTLQPAHISPWFHDWWSTFWGNFVFPETGAQADVDVIGRWSDHSRLRTFVAAESDNASIRGMHLDHVLTRVMITPSFQDVRWFEAGAGGHSGRGSFARILDPETGRLLRTCFDVSGDLDPHAVAAMIGGGIPAIVEPFTFTSPPELRVSGTVHNLAGGATRAEVDVWAAASRPLTFHKFPLDRLEVTAVQRGGRLDLPRLDAGIAGGTATATARLWDEGDERLLAVDVGLAGADLQQIRRAITRFLPEPENPAAVEEQIAKMRGRLDFSYKGEGLQNDFLSGSGGGSLHITGAELGQLHLFGGLSEVLDNTVLGFTSMRMKEAEGAFTLSERRITFPDLRVGGEGALVRISGSCTMSGRLDGTARVYPFKESGSVFGSLLNIVTAPISNSVEVELRGTLARPRWSLGINLGGPPAEEAPQAAAPAPAAAPPPAANAAP